MLRPKVALAMIHLIQQRRLAVIISAALAGLSFSSLYAASAEERKHEVAVTSEVSTWLVDFSEPGLLKQQRSRLGHQRIDLHSADAQVHRDHLKQTQAAHRATIQSAIGRSPEVSHHYLATHSGMAMRLSAAEATLVARLPGVATVKPQIFESIDTDLSPAFIGATSVWDGTAVAGGVGTRGEGMTIAVLDTGIVSTTHASFANVPSCGHHAKNPKVRSLLDCLTTDDNGLCNGPDPLDGNNHGSHTASTSGGNAVPASTPAPTAAISGIAPCASLRIYKVCQTSSCAQADIIAGLNSVLLHGDIDAMNYSISGGGSPWTDNDRLKLDLVDSGVFVAASAGNTSASVPDPVGKVNHLGAWVLTVAATTHLSTPEYLWSGSFRGPTRVPLGDLQKPDLAAPGVNVYAATISPFFGYGRMTGTSMAAPHVTGAATLIRNIHPSWTPLEVKSALLTTAKRAGLSDDGATPWNWDEVGSGRLDLAHAARVGLVLDETIDNFLAANPEGGSIDVSGLNLPALRDVDCAPECGFARSVRNATDAPASWRITVEDMEGFDVEVTPADFVIDAGATQTLTFTASPVFGEPGVSIDFGAVTFDSIPAGLHPSQHFTVALKGQGQLDGMFADGFDVEHVYVSGPIGHPVAATIDGTSINWINGAIVDSAPASGYDLNLYLGASAIPNGLAAWWSSAPAINAGVAASPSSSNYTVLGPGAVVGPGSIFSRTNGPMSGWIAGTTGYLGFRFDCSALTTPPASGACYGYLHLSTTTGSGFPATILDYGYNLLGNPVAIP